MSKKTALYISCLILFSCNQNSNSKETAKFNQLVGTWKLISGTLIVKTDTTVTDYSKNLSFIKIINDTHFSFTLHDLHKGKDSSAVFAAGAGTYTLKDSAYTEHLEYCNDRQWEGHDFNFVITIKGDTLIQKGVEKVEAAGVDRYNIEKYVRLGN